MHDLLSPYLLALFFFFVALLYSSVGLAGGSSYAALLTIFGVNAMAIPTVTLAMNLLVSTIGSFNYVRNRHARAGLILPFFVSSIPMSYLGGSLQVSKTVFYWLLLLSLVIVALRIYIWNNITFTHSLGRPGRLLVSLAAGAILGLVSGIVGIGGGIYLVPLILIFGLGTEKEAAACGVLFIWVNSLAGLASRFQYNYIDIRYYLPAIIAVIAGGVIGSSLGATRFSPRTMQRLLGVIVLVAILLLVPKLVTP